MSDSGDGLTVYFAANASDEDGILGYQWFFGDLSFADGQNVSHTYREPGVYTVTCYVADGIGNTSWQQLDILVQG